MPVRNMFCVDSHCYLQVVLEMTLMSAEQSSDSMKDRKENQLESIEPLTPNYRFPKNLLLQAAKQIHHMVAMAPYMFSKCNKHVYGTNCDRI